MASARHRAAVVRDGLLVQCDERQRLEVAGAREVARRAAVRMVERLMYEVPHVSFARAQVDVLTEYRRPDGGVTSLCLLSTRVTREQAADADWEGDDHVAMLTEWETREDTPGGPVDPDAGAVISAAMIDAAEDALRAEREKDGEA